MRQAYATGRINQVAISFHVKNTFDEIYGPIKEVCFIAKCAFSNITTIFTNLISIIDLDSIAFINLIIKGQFHHLTPSMRLLFSLENRGGVHAPKASFQEWIDIFEKNTILRNEDISYQAKTANNSWLLITIECEHDLCFQ